MTLTNGRSIRDFVDLTEEDELASDLGTSGPATSKAQSALLQIASPLEVLAPHLRPKLTPSTRNSTDGQVPAQGIVNGGWQHGSQENKRTAAPTPELRTQVYASRPSPTRLRTPTTAPNNETDSNIPGRKPRTAALDAGRSIARDYDILNPLEERYQATVNTQKRPGRPKRDEWTPTNQYNPKSGSSRGPERTYKDMDLANEDPASPVPRTPDSHIANGQGKGQLKVPLNIPTKRRRSSPLLEIGTPAKLLRSANMQYGNSVPAREWVNKQSQNHDKALSLQLIRDCREPNQAGDQDGLSASPPIARRSDTANPSADTILKASFSTIIYPAIKKATKRHKGILTEKQLVSVGKSVAVDSIRKAFDLIPVQRPSWPDDEQRKQIKRFVREDFDLKVARTGSSPRRQPSATETDSANSSVPMVQREKKPVDVAEKRRSQVTIEINDKRHDILKPANAARITDLAGYLTKLENETLRLNSQDAEKFGGFVRENVSNAAGSSKSWADQPRLTAVALPLNASPAMASTAKASPQPVFATDELFPPNFDRGRYPMKRRRRRNKFYIPERKSTTPKVEVIKAPHAATRIPGQESGNELFNPKSSATTLSQQVQGMACLPQARPIEVEIIQLLAQRSSSDKVLGDLLKLTASGEATTSEVAELDGYIEKIRASLASDKGGLANYAQPSSGLARNINGVANTDSLMRSPDNMPDAPLGYDNPVHSPPSGERESACGVKDSNAHVSQRKERRDLLSVLKTRFSPMSTTGSRRDADKEAPNAQLTSSSVSATLGKGHLNKPSRTFHPILTPVMAPLAENQVSIHRPLSTALDPHLEHLVAVSVLNDTGSPIPQEQDKTYSISSYQQRDLVNNPSLVIRADSVMGARAASRQPKVVRIESRIVDPARRPQQSTASLLRHRELGSDSRGRHFDTHNELRLRTAEMVEPWRSWKGASGDIVAAAWAPDSVTYAVGAAAHTNVEDLQYNRPCNLLLGELTSNILTELPDHRVDRPKPETLASGPNATQAVYNACDPMVYETVTSITFAPTGHYMYTASHDRTVKIWDTARKRCLNTLPHDAWVTSVEVSPYKAGLFATATKKIRDSIRIYYAESPEDALVQSCISSSRAELKPDWQIYPECLRWGSGPHTHHLLLAGFHQWHDDSNGLGQVVLWDALAFASIKVLPSAQSVYAAAWHPHSSLFATGGAPGGMITNRYSTKTVVRAWDLRNTMRYTVEYECSAVDMQDVTFSPADPNIITAGCTDGASYVWDFRRPDHPLHRLEHGRPIVELDHTRDREEADAGVMMSVWGLGGTLFYTGSSDGMVKAWDVRRHPADALVRDVAQFDAGVQSGAFSPDGTNLLVGDADGAFHILSSAPCGPRDGKYEGMEEPIDLVRALDGSGSRLENDDDNPGTEGREIGQELIESGQLDLHPEFGVTRGQNYCGPWARDSRKDDPEPNKVGRLLPEYANLQAFSSKGEERPEIAERIRGLIRARKLLIDDELNKYRRESAVDQGTQKKDRITPLAISDPSPQVPGSSQSPYPYDNAHLTGHGPNVTDSISINRPVKHDRSGLPKEAKLSMPSAPKTLFGAKNNTIPESRMVEENHWWPRLGEDEIMKAREKARHGRG
ncbi:hypothetical protein N7G274_005460 [Stereocaulon virgatum]|uniref:WD40 repeat-like protein n=1 Tax=Stereocaulon virgatum TaxID=373712 RepID=A0ABR4A9W3_9LECA